MSSKVMYDGDLGVNEALAVVKNGCNNVLQITGISGNGTVKFETSADGGSTWVEDETLEKSADGNITLENVNAIVRTVDTAVTDKTLLKIILGY